MIDEFINEITELKKYKEMYENQKKDKIVMSNKLYELMMQIYNQQSYETRKDMFKKESCKDCKYYNDCELGIPKNILEPIPSVEGWIPAIRSCGHFEWY